jgi:hypothetical protein
MGAKYKTLVIIKVTLSSFVLAGFFSADLFAAETESPDPNQNSKYLEAVREFADNVLKYGRDTYGPKHTPLFVDGLNIHTHEPLKWISQKHDRWILSNAESKAVTEKSGLLWIVGRFGEHIILTKNSSISQAHQFA